ncbi:heavy-metal-associated domain-containing protein [Clostridium sp. SYSU_GA19001]|uniref:heavy-metal-associated domain-containing protein n=1 Tax=Clostridium caldaquaticum TaxID=2940653 RepID=UPI00207743E2|nr:heavy metal-associated domain-containing protein [Clostridium caldaquaticum]MCM8709699.1 heavy-metal-associated domain-containing protein [Clostridium caldaquaticum]
MKTVHYSVSGIANRKSKAQVLNALDKIKGVQKVAVDVARGTIEVQYNEPANPDSIKNCIEHTGYIIQD